MPAVRQTGTLVDGPGEVTIDAAMVRKGIITVSILLEVVTLSFCAYMSSSGNGSYWLRLSGDNGATYPSDPREARVSLNLRRSGIGLVHQSYLLPTRTVAYGRIAMLGLVLERYGSGPPVICGVSRAEYQEICDRERMAVRWIFIPVWMPLVAFAAYPTLAFIGGPVSRRRRRRRNECVRCGYSLKGLAEPKCPECGSEI